MDEQRVREIVQEELTKAEKKAAVLTTTAEKYLSNSARLELTISIEDKAINSVTVSEVNKAITEALKEISLKTKQWQQW